MLISGSLWNVLSRPINPLHSTMHSPDMCGTDFLRPLLVLSTPKPPSWESIPLSVDEWPLYTSNPEKEVVHNNLKQISTIILIVDIGGSENGTKDILFWYSMENAFLNKTKKLPCCYLGSSSKALYKHFRYQIKFWIGNKEIIASYWHE